MTPKRHRSSSTLLLVRRDLPQSIPGQEQEAVHIYLKISYDSFVNSHAKDDEHRYGRSIKRLPD
jgi:hypothetical protein